MRGMRQVTTCVVVVGILLVAGCSRSEGGTGAAAAAGEPLPVDPADQALVDELRGLPFGAPNVDVVTDLLAESGVGVYPDDAADGDEPVRLTRWQVGNLAAEAANGGGVSGATVSELAGMPEGAPPASYLLAAWVASYPSPAAGFARALLGEQEWQQADQVVFPKLLLTLFVADAVAAGPQGYEPGGKQVAGLRQVSVSTVAQANACSAANSFIQKGIADVAEALKVDTSGGGILGFLGSIWNFAVDLAAGVVRGLVQAFKDLTVGLLVDAFAAVAVIQAVYSYVVEWRADLVATPDRNRFGVGSEVVTGELEVQVLDNQLPVPDLILDCARVFGVDMAEVGSAEGSEVDWDFFSPARVDLATPTSSDSRLDEQRTARFGYRTGQEPPELVATGDERAALFKLRAIVHRNDVEKIRQLLNSLVTDRLPAAIASVVSSLTQPIINAATERLRDLVDVKASELVAVTFHVPTEPDGPSAAPSDEPGDQEATATMPAGCPNAAVTEFGYSELGSRTESGVLSCFYERGRNITQLGVAISPVTATEELTPHPDEELVDIPGADRAWISGGEGVWSIRVAVGDQAMVVGGGVDSREELVAIVKRILGVG